MIFLLTILFTLECCGRLNITVMVENEANSTLSGEYELLNGHIRGRTTYVRKMPEQMYLFYYESYWRTGRSTTIDQNTHPFIELESEVYTCPENEKNVWHYYIPNVDPPSEQDNIKINVMCLGKPYPSITMHLLMTVTLL